jgi:hypothetical protein
MMSIFQVIDQIISKKSSLDSYEHAKKEIKYDELSSSTAQELEYLIGDVDYHIDCLRHKYRNKTNQNTLVLEELAFALQEIKEEYLHLWENFPRKDSEGLAYCYVCGSSLKYDYFVETDKDGLRVLFPSKESCYCCRFTYDFISDELPLERLKKKVLDHREYWKSHGYKVYIDTRYKLEPRPKQISVCNMYAHARFLEVGKFELKIRKLVCFIRSFLGL